MNCQQSHYQDISRPLGSSLVVAVGGELERWFDARSRWWRVSHGFWWEVNFLSSTRLSGGGFMDSPHSFANGERKWCLPILQLSQKFRWATFEAQLWLSFAHFAYFMWVWKQLHTSFYLSFHRRERWRSQLYVRVVILCTCLVNAIWSFIVHDFVRPSERNCRAVLSLMAKCALYHPV